MGINSIIILRRRQLKVHIQEEAERISSWLEQEEVVVLTKGINKEIGGASGVVVIVIGNGHDTSSNPGRD